MKNIFLKIIFCTLFILSGSISAQAPDDSVAIEAMSKLSVLNGTWEGSGWAMDMKMQKNKSYITETLNWKIDNTLLLFEEIGKDDSGEVTHHAMYTVFYDLANIEYRIHTHLKGGHYTDALFEIVEENKKFKWTIDSHGSTIVYSLTIEDNTWTEIGTYSRPSMEEPMTFFEVTLQKVE